MIVVFVCSSFCCRIKVVICVGSSSSCRPLGMKVPGSDLWWYASRRGQVKTCSSPTGTTSQWRRQESLVRLVLSEVGVV